MSKRKSITKANQIASKKLSRRQFLALSGGAVAGLTLAACAPGQTASPTAAPGATSVPTVISQEPRKIVLSTWGGPTEAAVKKFVAPIMERDFNATIEYDIGGLGARLTKVEAEAANPQSTVYFGSDDAIYQGKVKGLFAEFNPANIPNLSSLPAWATPKEIAGIGVGRTLLACGLVQHNGNVSSPVSSWNDMWRPEFVNKLAFLAPGNGFLQGMIIVVSELYGGSQDNIDPGLEALAELRPLTQVFTYTDFEAQMQSGDVTLAANQDYETAQMQKDGLDVSWIMPAEGGIAQLSCAALVKGGPHPDLGEALINTLLDPEIQLQFANEIYNAPTNQQVKLESPVADQVMYGPRIEQLRWFDMEFKYNRRAEWVERFTTEVVPKWTG